MIRRDRLKALLLDLIQIDNTSRRERELGMRLKQELESMRAEVRIDDAGDPHPQRVVERPGPVQGWIVFETVRVNAAQKVS
jgi:hypothetical protein